MVLLQIEAGSGPPDTVPYWCTKAQIAILPFRLVPYKLPTSRSLQRQLCSSAFLFAKTQVCRKKIRFVGSGLAPLLLIAPLYLSKKGRRSLKFTFDTCILIRSRHDSVNWLVGRHSFKTNSIRPSTLLACPPPLPPTWKVVTKTKDC